MDLRLKETLVVTQEECAEVVQSIAKIFRFGLTDKNLASLKQELADVSTMVDLLIEQGISSDEELRIAKQAKIEKLKRYTTHIFS